MSITVLIADDEDDILDLLKYNLQKEGYNVVTARDGNAALELARSKPDVIVLDVMMPGLDGFEVCKQLKRNADTRPIPVIFLSARKSDVDEVVGLELGADEYIVKPVSIAKLLARIRLVLRRSAAANDSVNSPPDRIVVGELEINLTHRTITVGNTSPILTRKEFGTLAYLATHRGAVVPKNRLMSAIWGRDAQADDRTLDVHVCLVRGKLGAYGSYIETVKGVGYRFRSEAS
jgi:DNA-binding response OmpR family regulator